MPDTSLKMQKYLGLLNLNLDNNFYLLENLKKFKSIPKNTQVLKLVSLFPRIEIKKQDISSSASQTDLKNNLKEAKKPEITIDDLNKIDLRVATILSAELVPKAKKLLKLEVELEKLNEKRIIIAGIALSYKPEDLIGKQIIIVANLKPAKLMGIVSNGMLLAATDMTDEKTQITSFVTLDKPVKSGSALR